MLLWSMAPASAWATELGWSIAFHSSDRMDCTQIGQIAEQADWREALVDVPPLLARSRAMWVRASPGPDAGAAALVAHDQLRAVWFDFRNPDEPLRITINDKPRAAPGMLAVQLPAAAQSPIYLCLTDQLRSTSTVRAQSISLMSGADLRAAELRSIATLATLVGVMLAMGTLALIFYLSVREPVFAAYAIYVWCFAGYVLQSAEALGLLLPAALRSANTVTAITLALIALMANAGLRYTLAYTRIDAVWPRLTRVSVVLCRLAMLSALMRLGAIAFDADSTQVASALNLALNISIGLLILSIMPPVIDLAWRGRREARVYLIGWAPPLLVLMGFILRYLGITPEALWPSAQLLMLAAAFESLVLGWGLVDRMREVRQEREQAAQMADHDVLTGALNRRGLDCALEVAAGSTDCVLLYLDIDHFKRINDAHGHAVGDRCLRRFVEVCTQQLRGVDTLGRYGGEEFVAILWQTGLAQGRLVAERMRVAVESDPAAPVPFTVSIGVALHGKTDSAQRWLERADQALYAAKSQGRNQLVEAQA